MAFPLANPVLSIYNAYSTAKGLTRSISDMNAIGTLTVYQADFSETADIVRITGTGTIKSNVTQLDDEDQPEITFTLSFEDDDYLTPTFQIPWGEFTLRFYFQFLITFQNIEHNEPQPSPLTYKVGGIVLNANLQQENWMITPGSNTIDASVNQVADVTGEIEFRILQFGEELFIEFEQCAVEYLRRTDPEET